MSRAQSGQTPVAVVTGGGSGIGLACAVELARLGFDPVVVGRRPDVLDTACAQIRAVAPAAHPTPFACDLSSRDGPASVVQRVMTQRGRIDVLVNAAATCATVPILQLTSSTWDATLDVALRGAALCSVEVARHMAGRGARIIMITSIDEEVVEPDVAHYSAAKAGLGAFARSLAVQLGRQNITVNSVAPGWVRTATAAPRLDRATDESLDRLNALGRPADPTEIANVVGYLALNAPAFLTGSTIVVDGGQSVKAAMP